MQASGSGGLISLAGEHHHAGGPGGELPARAFADFFHLGTPSLPQGDPCSLEFRLGLRQTALQIVPHLVGGQLDLLPGLAALPAEHLHAVGGGMLPGTQGLKLLAPLDPHVGCARATEMITGG